MILDLQLLAILIIPLLASADHCGPVSETADATIDPDAGDFVVLAEINNTTQKYCQYSCCDILETDDCNTALFHHSTDKCTLIRCENEKCSLITDSSFTTTSIGVIEDVTTTDQPQQNTEPTSRSPIQIFTTVTDDKTASSATQQTQDDVKSTTRLIPPNTSTAGTDNTPANTFTTGKSATTTESILTTLFNNITQTSKAVSTKPNNITDTVAITDKTEPPVSMSTTQHQVLQLLATLPATKLLTSTVQGPLVPSQGTHNVDTTTSSHITEKIDQAANTTVKARTTLEPSTLSSNKTTSVVVITDTGNTIETNTTEMDVPITTTLGPASSSTHTIPPTTSRTLENATLQQIANATVDTSIKATQQGETTMIPTQMLTSQTNRATIPNSQPIQTTSKAASTTLVKSPQSITESPAGGKGTNDSTEPVTTTKTLLNTTAALENQTESSNSQSSAPSKHFFVSQDDQLPALLIAASSIGIIFIFTVFVLLGKRVFDSWQRRHYSRIDYLINGMYN